MLNAGLRDRLLPVLSSHGEPQPWQGTPVHHRLLDLGISTLVILSLDFTMLDHSLGQSYFPIRFCS